MRALTAAQVLRGLLLLCVLFPLSIFVYGSWATYQNVIGELDRTITRNLDLIAEHAAKVFETVDGAIREVDAMTDGLSDGDVIQNRRSIAERLRLVSATLRQVDQLWILDANGHPLVSSRPEKELSGETFSSEEWFTGAKGAASAESLYIGRVEHLPELNERDFFGVTRRVGEGRIILATVAPEYFEDVYRRIVVGGPLDQAALMRSDGAFLARVPSFAQGLIGLPAPSHFLAQISREPNGGFFNSVSPIDQTDRRLGYRLLSGLPIYVQSGVEAGSVRRRVMDDMLQHLYFGVPATLLMVGLCLIALRSVRVAGEEADARLRAEHALLETQRLEALGRVTAGVAHDFNNLLTIVQGNVESLRRTTSEERRARNLDLIQRAIARGTGLTRQLLTIGRRQALDPVRLETEEFLRSALQLFSKALPETISTGIHVERGVWPIHADPGELEVALLNLAVNARDAMPGGGELKVSARNVDRNVARKFGLDGEFVSVSLCDTGAGMGAETMKHALEPFFTTKERGQGTGLGLSQVYGFAQQSGGLVHIDSTPGAGTCVTLLLPRSFGQAAPVGPAPTNRGSRNGRALLVEDDDEVRASLSQQLAAIGFEVTQAADASTALDLLARTPFDVMVSDISMPGTMNGLQLAQHVRREHPAVRVVLASAYSQLQDEVASLNIPFVRKPFSTQELEAVL